MSASPVKYRQVSLSADDYAGLETIAQAEGRSVAATVRRAVAVYDRLPSATDALDTALLEARYLARHIDGERIAGPSSAEMIGAVVAKLSEALRALEDPAR